MSEDVLVFVVIGFLAQLVDGALGMAFGALATTSLLTFGVPPATASAMTHVAEIFTTAASGASHLYHRNVNWNLVLRLAPAGMLGGAAGAYLLATVDAAIVGPVVSLYLAAVGVYILVRAFRPWQRKVDDRVVPIIGAAGGFLDAAGGGGWGAVVTGSLVGGGHPPRSVIGSTNLTEFLVTLVISATFVLSLGWAQLEAAIGLIIGGVIAAPLGGLLVSRVPTRPLTIAVAIIIIATSIPRIV